MGFVCKDRGIALGWYEAAPLALKMKVATGWGGIAPPDAQRSGFLAVLGEEMGRMRRMGMMQRFLEDMIPISRIFVHNNALIFPKAFALS